MSCSDVAEYYDRTGKRGLIESEKFYGTADDVSIALTMLEDGDRILDLGCGHGRVALPLAEHGFELWGIDISSALIEAARMDAAVAQQPVTYTVGNIVDLPYESFFFHKVICFWGSFSHLLCLEDQVRCLDEICRVLKPGGYGFIVLPDPKEP